MADTFLEDIVDVGVLPAPSDGKEYVMKDGVWVENTDDDSWTDAPSDGKEYVRKDGAWAVKTGGSPVASIETASFDASAGKYYVTATGADVVASIAADELSDGEYLTIHVDGASTHEVHIDTTNYSITGPLGTTSGGDMLMLRANNTVEMVCNSSVLHIVDVGASPVYEANNKFDLQTTSFTATKGEDYVVNAASDVTVSIGAGTILVGDEFSIMNGNTSAGNVLVDSTNYDLVGDTATVTGGDTLTIAKGQAIRLLCLAATELHVAKK